MACEVSGCGSGASQRRVCIIGAGLSGLTTAKVFAERGFQCTIFERDSKIGGVWNGAYRNVRLQQHQADFKLCGLSWPQGTPVFPGKTDVLKYATEFAESNHLSKLIHFNTTVTDAHFDNFRGVWVVTVEDGVSGGISAEGGYAVGGGQYEYEYLIVACGSLGSPKREVSAQLRKEGYRGHLIHSSDYDAPGPEYYGRRVLVVGGSSSGVEVAVDLARVASEVTLLLREDSEQWVFPRHGLLGIPLRFCGSANLCEPLWLRNLRARLLFALRFGNTLKRFGIYPRHAPMNGKIIASDEFYTYLEHGAIKLRRSANVRGSSDNELALVYADGEKQEADAVITCTGFEPPGPNSLPFLRQYIDNKTGLSGLYRTVFNPDVPHCAFVGYAFGFVAIPAAAELQAKAAANVFTGRVRLPSPKEQKRQAAEEAKSNGWGTTLWLTDNRAYCALEALAYPGQAVWGCNALTYVAFGVISAALALLLYIWTAVLKR